MSHLAGRWGGKLRNLGGGVMKYNNKNCSETYFAGGGGGTLHVLVQGSRYMIA